MRNIHAKPPNFDAIAAVFPQAKGYGVVFTWGDAIYNPSGVAIEHYLKAHEAVHYSRQTNDTARIQAWWDRYLIDPEFRFAEEVPAHRAEFKSFCARYKQAAQRHDFLLHVTARLSGPLYGGLVSAYEARKLITR